MRDLQHEATAHIAVQQWIDDGGLKGRAVTADAIREIQRRFCEHLPDDLLWAVDPTTKERIRVIPGELRHRDVAVGAHIPVSPGASYSRLGKTETILATAAAHHRLVWIHPFLDGNGRVARLMSHATLLDALDTGGRLVSRARPRPQCRCLQGTSFRLRSDPAQRSRRPGQSERRKPRGIHAILSDDLPRPTGCAPAFCSGPRRKSAFIACRPNLAPSLKPCSIAASSRAATSPPSSARANVRPAAWCRRYSNAA